MNIVICAYIFVIGLIVGSFLNVCIYRIPRGESIAYPPSHCTVCGSRIKYYDLIPIVSWIALRGKCRNCGERISIKYPLIELSTGLLFALAYIEYGLTIYSLKYIVLISYLIVIGIIDYNTTDVYSVTTWSGIILGVVFIIINYFMGLPIKTYIYGGLLSGGIIAVIILLTNGMGWGDAEICLLSGLFLGLANSIVMLLLSFIIGGIVGVMLIVTKRKTKKDYIPFGPSISVAAIIVIFMGDKIIDLYMKILLP
ncbi:type 4 prepilin-like protein leader peptide-processing enzyme [Clostridium tepidiprofundi DSM 19306]|uniref:Type 4 prepilin-like protein leader peptide-processing enzyme n=1 Tax=Clostridium tepidiprofundi DSM 19306 TaxID=1121338 RepID=A0A151B6B1_9CLOT|nr:A24 family peptidase [Clostridium tepidiprofundi]KYH35320.1 type 4 prepilin-like protein leader peptide-processing enzyme [Clostridium tepidiprofundi DSM 19306]